MDKRSTSRPSTNCCASRSRASSRARSSRLRRRWEDARLRAARGAAQDGRGRHARPDVRARARRRRRRRADQPGLRRGAVAVAPSAASSSPCSCTPTWPARTCTTPARAAQKARWMPGITARRDDHRGRHHRARRRLRRRGHAHHARVRDGDALGARTAPSCSSPTACTPTCTSSPRAPAAARHASRSSSSRRARRASRSGARSTRPAGCSSDTAELVFDNCRIPAAQPAGRRGQGLPRGDEELPDRAHRAGGDGGGPLHAGVAADAGPRARRARPSAPRCGTSRRCASASRCSTPRPAPRANTCTTAPGA